MRTSAAIAAAVVLLCLGIVAAADTVVLKSGNVPVGQRDPLITVEGAPVIIAGTSHPAAPVPLQQALVLTSYSGWAELPGSMWVGVADGTTNSPSGGYVYRTGFELPLQYTNPQIILTMSSDNHSVATLNGNFLGSVPQIVGEWGELFVFSSADPVVFRSGRNILEFDLENGGFDPSGLLFRADVAYTPVPEPSSILALLCGIGGGGWLAWRRLK